MQYNKNLKKEIEAAANEYFYHKSKGTSNLEPFEDRVVKVSENYVFQKSLRNRPTILIEDLKQHARIGIISAIRSYDPTKGLFASWVIYKVRREVNRNKAGDWIKVPELVKQKISNLSSFEHQMLSKEQRKPTENEIQERFDWNPKMLQRVQITKEQSKVDIDSADYLFNTQDQKLNTKIDVSNALSELGNLEKKICEMFYLEEYNITEISEKTGVPSARVRRIIDRSTNKLKESLIEYS